LSNIERLEQRIVYSAGGGSNANQFIDTSLTPTDLARSLVGTGVEISNVQFTGSDMSTGSFDFTDPSVVGFSQGIVLSSGRADDVVGPNAADDTSTYFTGAGNGDLSQLSGFETFDAAVLEFDFVPTANQVVFYYTFASEEYPEWVNTPFNDVFAFFVNGTNYAEVRQIAGDPAAPFVPVAVNNINNSNPIQDPLPDPMRPDLFRSNYFNPNGASAIDLELDGITQVLTFQAPVVPGEPNHMKLAIADASDGILDSAVFIQAGSLVSNENPVADLSLSPSFGNAPLLVTAIVEGEDPNGAPLTYSIDWGDGTVSSGNLNDPVGESEKTALADHTYTIGGGYIVTLTVSNGTLSGTSIEDVDVIGSSTLPDTTITSQPADPSNDATPSFQFASTVAGSTFEYRLDGGAYALAGSDLTIDPLSDGTHTLLVRAKDPEGNVDPTPASYTWLIDTLAPDTTITAQPSDPSNDATPSFIFAASEAGVGFEYQVDGGSYVAAGSEVTLDALADGKHSLQVRAIDAAGNVDATPANYSWTIDTTPAVVSASLVADPNDPGRSLLQVLGTPNNDVLAIDIKGQQTQVRNLQGGVTVASFATSDFQGIVAFGLDGNDTILLDANIEQPVTLHGGAGNDVLYGARGNDVLFGDAGDDILYGRDGNDTLTGGAGNDVLVGGAGDDQLTAGSDASVLIGGDGRDTLVGGSAGDLLIGAAIKKEANTTALLSILAEWKRTDLSYGERIDHLTGDVAGGLNGKVVVNRKTLRYDDPGDSLFGGDGDDWFVAVASEVADRQAGERLS
jgi:Ca2+-binding RTX toxin-like protein